MRFKTKPVTIEAIRFDGNLASINQMCGAWPEFVRSAEWKQLPELLTLKIKTLEGDHRADSGDWIKRVKNEV